MLKLRSGRTLYYGKGDVLSYRTYAAPLTVRPIEASPYKGDSNIIFAHNITFSVSSEVLLSSFTEGDNTQVVATDSMKNFILRQTAQYGGSTTEGLLAFISERFMERYPHIDAIEIQADRLPFSAVTVADDSGWSDSQLVFRRSHNEHASASQKWKREGGAGILAEHESALSQIQLIKVSGSSFYGFVRDEYTTLPESFDRPLFIFLDIFWTYIDAGDACDSTHGNYVPSEQIHDLAHTQFHAEQSPSIQHLIYRIGMSILAHFPQLAEVRFESNNRTWETIVEPEQSAGAGVYTEPRPPYGFQGFTLSRADLEDGGDEA
ncbi:factor-independent urate hydroxylase [Paenibacillus sp. 2TAB23]|uniref:factor-independent urate hydroxylase n=1 Tax=Paenibacillus sp. 2TAB23 TaxID=3233004 RepID=UPI003F9B9B5D